MARRLLFSLLCCVLWLWLLPLARPVAAQSPVVLVLDETDTPLMALVDGDAVRLQISLAQPASADTAVDFLLDDLADPVANCTIRTGETSCQTDTVPTFGWAWDANRTRQTERIIQAVAAGQPLGRSAPLATTPRPVVMVHGFSAKWEVWSGYLGADGFLAPYGIQGYAVGDGQVPGVMNTGALSTPLARTNTIAQNAAALAEYIGNVQQTTGAEQVDLLVHSMGGIIARYYLDRVMETRNIAQLIILGSPMGGSSCSILPAALGLLLPAALELQPSYMQGIFNPQITRRQGVPFHALAGAKLLDTVQAPCTDVPSDLVVSIASAKAIAMPLQEMALLHPTLNDDPDVFTGFVLPHLQAPPGDAWQVADPPLLPPAEVLQFTRVYTGHLQPGETQAVTINIDPDVTVATFALYDTSHSLTTTVTGANGNTIQLAASTNGLIRVTDPATMVYLGYGFVQPRAGQWVVTLQTTADTPAAGADYAIAAQFNGGATLQATVDKLAPQVNETVNLQAQLTAAGQAVTLLSAQAEVRRPDGQMVSYPLAIEDTTIQLTLSPDQSGLYGVTVNVNAQTADGLAIDRAAFAVFEAQPTATDILQAQLLAGGIVILGLIAAGSGLFYWRRRAAKKRMARRRAVSLPQQSAGPRQPHPLLGSRRRRQ